MVDSWVPQPRTQCHGWRRLAGSDSSNTIARIARRLLYCVDTSRPQFERRGCPCVWEVASGVSFSPSSQFGRGGWHPHTHTATSYHHGIIVLSLLSKQNVVSDAKEGEDPWRSTRRGGNGRNRGLLPLRGGRDRGRYLFQRQLKARPRRPTSHMHSRRSIFWVHKPRGSAAA